MTLQQNKALHLWFAWWAEALQEQGVDMGSIRLNVPIRPSPDNFKELLWRPTMEATYPGVKSTRDLKGSDIDDVVDALTEGLGEQFGVHVPFPTEDDVKKEADRKWKERGEPDLICRR